MKIGDSVRLTIDMCGVGELEAAMLHACNAVDGTATKVAGARRGSNALFTNFLRDNYFILGPMGAPSIDLAKQRFPVTVENPKAEGGAPDLADVIYGIHRCTHGHGRELPGGFELMSDPGDPNVHRYFEFRHGSMRLSERIIFGLLAVVVLSPANVDQTITPGYYLSCGQVVMPIQDWWGRAADFPAIAAQYPVPVIDYDFTDWMDDPPSPGESS